MKTLLTSLFISAALLVGCMDDSSLLTAPESSANTQTEAPIWVQQSDGFQLSADKQNGKKGGGAKQDTVDITDPDGGGSRYGFTR